MLMGMVGGRGGLPAPPAGKKYLLLNGVPVKVNGKYVLVDA